MSAIARASITMRRVRMACVPPVSVSWRAQSPAAGLLYSRASQPSRGFARSSFYPDERGDLTLLPSRDKTTICFAHVAYRLQERFVRRNTGVASFEVRSPEEL